MFFSLEVAAMDQSPTVKLKASTKEKRFMTPVPRTALLPVQAFREVVDQIGRSVSGAIVAELVEPITGDIDRRITQLLRPAIRQLGRINEQQLG
jgi:hypothetical protein